MRNSLKQILIRLLGTLILTVATIFLIVFTASINAPQGLGGPMNMSPSPEGWFYIVLVIDALLLTAAYGGIKLLRLSKRAVGFLNFSIGLVILTLSLRNHIQSPPLVGINNTNMLAVPTFLHYYVYSLVGIFLLVGAWLIVRSAKRA